MPQKWPVVLASTNRKGGCAKTSSIFHVAAAFAQRGLRVLWVDLDPQGSLTQMIYPEEAFDVLLDGEGVTALLAGLPSAPEHLIHPGHASWNSAISLLPATAGLSDWNHPRPSDYAHLGYCLHQYLAEMAEHFDVVLIDTPPNLGLLTWIGLLAADAAYTPAAPEDFATQGIYYVERFVHEAQQHNQNLRWLGVLKTMVQPRLTVHVKFSQDLSDRFGVPLPGEAHSKLFDTLLPLHAVFKDAVWGKTPLPLFKPKCAAAKAVVAFAEELARRTGFVLPPLPTAKRSRKVA